MSERTERPSTADMVAAITAWEERCDLDYRCPEAGRWPRSAQEYESWAWDHGHKVVAYLKEHLATLPRGSA